MRNIWLLLLLSLVGGSSPLLAQNINLLGFVRPRVSVFSNYALPYQLNDSVSFSEFQSGLGVTIPLRTQLELKSNLKESKARALMLNANVRYRNLDTEVAGGPRNVLSFGAGLTGLHASFSKGIWIYTLGAGFVEQVEDFDAGTAYGYGGLVYLHLKSLKKINAYGAALIAGRGFILPLPIIGFVRVYKKKQTLTAVLPFFLRYARPVKSGSLRATLSLNGINAGLEPVPNRFYEFPAGLDRLRLSHSYAQFLFGYHPNLGKQWQMGLEAGLNFGTRLQVRDGRDRLYDARGPGTVYAGFSLSYRFPGKGLDRLLEGFGF